MKITLLHRAAFLPQARTTPMGLTQRNGRVASSSYYAVLGVSPGASAAEIRAAYRKLAMKWHPDRCAGVRIEEANERFQQIHDAYEVLSDERKRAAYDAGFLNPLDLADVDGAAEDAEGFFDFVQEMLRLMANVKREECSMDSLRRMLSEIANGFTVSSTETTQPPVATASTARSGLRVCEHNSSSRSTKRNGYIQANLPSKRRMSEAGSPFGMVGRGMYF
ncbi:hypothetical protein HPP92_023068 [Vanilla planifolia]|uniref:J domain-containing protein n=1 Tax=Vanilla planifolia TaxID=51239 RepID=A0A835UGB5_VANPL|nr:hypothetical protein HPP92_023068 [Vanilla planifolia]